MVGCSQLLLRERYEVWDCRIEGSGGCQVQTNTTAATPSPISVVEQMRIPEILRGQSEMPAVTSLPECCQMRLGSERPQSHKFILVHSPGTATNSILLNL
jgi:hypothetical protein